eukprot:1196347-Prorocentrum_minimum.AAC.4
MAHHTLRGSSGRGLLLVLPLALNAVLRVFPLTPLDARPNQSRPRINGMFLNPTNHVARINGIFLNPTNHVARINRLFLIPTENRWNSSFAEIRNSKFVIYHS